jgi:radical SAM superfamily enzyme YgiQ (UPF0313 family)
MRVLLLSCYELGHPPAGLARALGALCAAGLDAVALDLAVEALDEEQVRAAGLVAISVPMHTALRLGARLAPRLRALNPGCHLAFYGLYAGLNAAALRAAGADTVIGAEGEEALLALAQALARGGAVPAPPDPGRAARGARRLPLCPPAHGGLPPLARYARAIILGQERLAGYVEASSGCLHRCRHCPLPPVYDGRFYVTPIEDVLAEVQAQVERGAQHITFGDPDFLNGPGHARAIARAMAERAPGVSFDVTAKIEHLVRHPRLVGELAEAGCAFVVSAVESLSDPVLEVLDKGHTRADVMRALEVTRQAGLALRPSFVLFSPWETLAGYLDALDWVAREQLCEHVDPVQWTIRLLVPPGSLLEAHPGFVPHRAQLVARAFAWRWTHPDPRMDVLQQEVTQAVTAGIEAGQGAEQMFARVRVLAEAAAGISRGERGPAESPPPRRPVPRLTEPWFC